MHVILILLVSDAHFRFAEIGLNFNQDVLSIYNEALGLLMNESFPWDAARISTLSNLYSNSRTANTTSHRCETNQVGLHTHARTHARARACVLLLTTQLESGDWRKRTTTCGAQTHSLHPSVEFQPHEPPLWPRFFPYNRCIYGHEWAAILRPLRTHTWRICTMVRSVGS